MMRSTLRYIFAVTVLFPAALFVSCGEDASPISPGNSPPRTPYFPEPADSSESTSENLVVSWECSDPDGDLLLYIVQVKENDYDIVFAGQTTLKTMDTGHGLLRETMYTWRVIADDGLELSESDWWTFFTPAWSNEPPYQPGDPAPADEAVDIQVTGVHLSWSADDPDPDDTLTYDVYFGTDSDPERVATGLTETSYALPPLDYDTVYFWRVVSTDSHGESTLSPGWTFTTRAQPGGLFSRIGKLLGLTDHSAP